jgi:hypothetical protein
MYGKIIFYNNEDESVKEVWLDLNNKFIDFETPKDACRIHYCFSYHTNNCIVCDEKKMDMEDESIFGLKVRIIFYNNQRENIQMLELNNTKSWDDVELPKDVARIKFFINETRMSGKIIFYNHNDEIINEVGINLNHRIKEIELPRDAYRMHCCYSYHSTKCIVFDTHLKNQYGIDLGYIYISMQLVFYNHQEETMMGLELFKNYNWYDMTIPTDLARIKCKLLFHYLL